MNRFYRSSFIVVSSLFLAVCSSASHPAETSAEAPPFEVLMAGNQRYMQGHPLNVQNTYDERPQLVAGQNPIAIVVGCSDSRVPPEIVFDQGLGKLFVIRVAGNVLDDHALGSIEYAAEHLHTHLIVVLGHDKCGAVQAAVSGGELPGHMQSFVQSIQPAVEEARKYPGDLLDLAIDANVRYVVKQLKTSQPILAHLVDTGELKVAGTRYKLATGEVQILSPP